MTTPAFKRVLLKLSGEALAANQGFGVDTARIHEVAAELADVQKLGVQLAIVVGGGNFFRGVADQARDMDRVSADHMGMLATVINALALQDADFRRRHGQPLLLYRHRRISAGDGDQGRGDSQSHQG